ncbi:stress responsive protein [Phyllobacterium phragmitis]|uniref:Stress responsive protein n=1 Tax=Phyllobacterium phragmitis TaxID=2670329 RepID=A0A2S9IUH7_9HYPH|nr:Dabb family protein [Phyllobacterium phragmitis]PRD44161.1 stress responsive protein [Phyllobacterium phragmitis]
MIRHIVLVRFREELNAAEIDNLLKSVHALQNRIEGILAVSSGANDSPEGLEKGFAHGFVVDFADAAARDAYLPHPAHVKVGQSLVAAALGGIEGILVFDFEM